MSNDQTTQSPNSRPTNGPALGVIFDWDGVIIDSSRHHEESWERLAADEKRPLPEGHFKAGFGKKTEWIIEHQLGFAHNESDVRRLSLQKEAHYREIVIERGIEILPGVRGLLERLRVAAVPCYIGSSTHRRNIELILKRLEIEGYFGGMVTAEDVSRGKPDPEVFLKAAERIQREPRYCVVFEDSLSGIEAAIAGGMKTVGVATTHDRKTLESKVDRVVERLDELEVVDLLALIAN
jgi:HAD superfamily hydrolase (TIGR01509 family)